METPKVDEMIKSLDWQVNNSRFTTQRNIDLLSELKAMKQALNIHNVVGSFCECQCTTSDFELDDGTTCCCACEKEIAT